jgi:hypothetical protein
MMASSRPDVACVIAEGAPTNLLTLPTETAYNPVTHLSDQTSGPAWIYNFAVAAFGGSQLAAVSPALHPGTARLFLAAAQQDEYIPWAQAQEMAAAAPTGTYTDTLQLAAGSAAIGFTHVSTAQGTGVSQPAYNDYLVRQLKAVTPLVAPPGVSNSVINDIRLLPSMGGYSLGDEELDATLSPAQAQVTVGGRAALGPGKSFKLVGCAAYYDPVAAPRAVCVQSLVDTRPNAGVVAVAIPGVSATWSRPAAGMGAGFAYGVVWLYSLDATGKWVLVAASTPDRNLDSGFSVSPAG